MITIPEVGNIITKQRSFFREGHTLPLNFRRHQLEILQQMIQEHETDIISALKEDMNKPAVESFFGDVDIVLKEIKFALRHLDSWTQTKHVKTPLFHFPARSFIQPEPLGVVLIISAWNFPFQQLFVPLAGAIAAGNCTVLKPSEFASHSSALIAKLVKEYFNPDFISVVEGGVPETQALLNEEWGHIFFTGSTAVGKIVMAAAANYVTPVTLELGGKSPCIVEADADLKTAAHRIAWGKFINAGQVCTAIDYLWVHESIKDNLVSELKRVLLEFYGQDPSQSPDLARIISDKHFYRLINYFKDGTVVHGSQTDVSQKFIAPTILENVRWESPVMQEEIFGPILPIMTYRNLNEVIVRLSSLPKPLGIYFFSNNQQQQERILQHTSSGGVTINDIMLHGTLRTLPYGGVGASGQGAYHGKTTFDTFAHYKSVLKKSMAFDIPIRYAPYKGKLSQIRRLTQWLNW